MVKVNNIKVGQVYIIGKKTRELVKEANNLDFEIGNQVEILTHPYLCLFKVRCIKTGFYFDINNKSLGKLIKDI